jgi:hypothetical protein
MKDNVLAVVVPILRVMLVSELVAT